MTNILNYLVENPRYIIFNGDKNILININTLMNLRVQVAKKNIEPFSFIDEEDVVHVVNPNGTIDTTPYGINIMSDLSHELLKTL